jgi:phosphoglycolate phosphatase
VTLVRPRALLFDWDNTLVDTWETIHAALNTALTAMGHEPWTPEETRARVRASARDTFPALFGDRADEATGIFYRAFESQHLQTLRERDGADAMLRALAKLDPLYLAVVSNKNGHLLRREADHIGWTDCFTRLVGANDAAKDKPAVEAVELALSESGLAPGPDVWFIGDTDIDMACAVAAGCTPVLLRPEAPDEGEFPGTEPHLHIVSCQALLAVIQSF